MKATLNKLFFILIWALAIVGIVSLFSCKSAEWHFDKFQKKGGKITCETDTIKLIDTLTIDGQTTYVVRDSIVYKPFENVVTKWETKYLYKTLKENNEVIKYQTKWKTKEVIKTAKARLPWWVWVLVALSVMQLVRWVLAIVGAFRNMPNVKN